MVSIKKLRARDVPEFFCFIHLTQMENIDQDDHGRKAIVDDHGQPRSLMVVMSGPEATAGRCGSYGTAWG